MDGDLTVILGFIVFIYGFSVGYAITKLLLYTKHPELGLAESARDDNIATELKQEQKP